MENREKEDLLYEGRQEASLDVDRMINEGMAGGTVTSEGSAQIGHSTELPKEERPRKMNDDEK